MRTLLNNYLWDAYLQRLFKTKLSSCFASSIDLEFAKTKQFFLIFIFMKACNQFLVSFSKFGIALINR